MNCPNCGREVGNTAGLCVQCTMEIKNNPSPKAKEVNKKGCPVCGGMDISQTDVNMFLCNSCSRMF